MFRRIHSKRDPADTIWSELGKMFGNYIEQAGSAFGRFCIRYPGAIFCGMVGLLLLSAGLSFTIFRQRASPHSAQAAAQHRQTGAGQSHQLIDDSFSRIAGTAAALQQTLSLKQQVDALLAKRRLSHADSLTLGRALDSLQALQHLIPH